MSTFICCAFPGKWERAVRCGEQWKVWSECPRITKSLGPETRPLWRARQETTNGADEWFDSATGAATQVWKQEAEGSHVLRHGFPRTGKMGHCCKGNLYQERSETSVLFIFSSGWFFCPWNSWSPCLKTTVLPEVITPQSLDQCTHWCI